MKKFSLVLAAGALMAISGSAFATTTTPAKQCATLEHQFDTAIKKHANAPKAADAKQARTEGGDMCKSGKQADGVKRLQEGIRDLGLKPRV
ncbi:hypothetical protein ACFPL7_18895 [Dongia soli]|uniref:PsiF repeat-containing protein n=1 Tax=Dongia soli TaxID=600628 RepID=A0ABU5E7Q8_9PROT|nr:hypothetical protein [Dongia soli]MDY0881660.1 hypothetical protein [Dongia soli]